MPRDRLVVSLFARYFAEWKVWPNEAKVAIAVLAGVLCPWRFGRPEVLSKQPIDYRHYRLPVGRRAAQVHGCGETLNSRAVSLLVSPCTRQAATSGWRRVRTERVGKVRNSSMGDLLRKELVATYSNTLVHACFRTWSALSV